MLEIQIRSEIWHSWGSFNKVPIW